MALHVMDEANHCLGCKNPRCQQGCPIHTNIPEVIRLLKANRLNDAGRMLFENNPLTTVCSLICNHENQCEGHCVRGIKGDPVHFSVIENYISSTYASQMTKGPAEPNGKRVAIIGSGPAGLTIAVILARYGYDVTIFESHDKIGGVLRYGIPEFRLPKSVLDDFEYRHLRLKDIKVRPNTDVGKALKIDDLFRDGFKAIFIGTGVWRPNTLHIKGESLGHVHFAINYLQNPDVYHLGNRVVVIGAGNAAMDVARTAIRHGKSVDTSMGFTPLEGVTMGTRSGSLDPDVVTYIQEKEHLSPEEISRILNKKSGFLGVSGISSDARDLDAAANAGEPRAKLALKKLTYEVTKYIGAYAAAMNGVDLIVFTGGIGENNSRLRRRVCENLTYMGVKFDYEANVATGKDTLISLTDSKVKVAVITTDEELVIARDTMHIVQGRE